MSTYELLKIVQTEGLPVKTVDIPYLDDEGMLELCNFIHEHYPAWIVWTKSFRATAQNQPGVHNLLEVNVSRHGTRLHLNLIDSIHAKLSINGMCLEIIDRHDKVVGGLILRS